MMIFIKSNPHAWIFCTNKVCLSNFNKIPTRMLKKICLSAIAKILNIWYNNINQ